MGQKRCMGVFESRDYCIATVAVVDHIDAMIAYWDEERVCRYANSAYLQWFGKTHDEMLGITLKELLGPLYEMNLPHIEAAYAGEKQIFERETPLPEGGALYSLTTYKPDVVDGKVRGIFVHVADVTPMKLLERELAASMARAEELATHDYLTGLPNRVLLNDRLEQAISGAKRHDELVAVVAIDLDNFKSVNDTYGHMEGDNLLIEIARRMREGLRETDTVTRLGGDEFLLLATDLNSVKQVKAMLARLLKATRVPYRLNDAVLNPTFSLGVALYPDNGATAKELLVISDNALYEAKRQGKDRYVFAP